MVHLISSHRLCLQSLDCSYTQKSLETKVFHTPPPKGNESLNSLGLHWLQMTETDLS